jgi:5-methylthioadenosine/S-adenosylhomocysteine deaminase
VNRGTIVLENLHLIKGAREDPVICDLYIEDGKIAAIDESMDARQPADIQLDGSECVGVPAFANLHIHCRPGRALSDGEPVPVWHRRVDLVSRNMTEEEAFVGGLVAFGELLLAGVTSGITMTRHFQGAARAAEALGIRAAVVPLAGDGGGVERGDLDDLDAALDVVTSYRSNGGRVQMWCGFDSPLTTSLEGMRKVAAAADEHQLGIHTHMAETEYEVQTFREKRGGPEPEGLAEQGILGPRTLLAHCNWLTDDEIALLAEKSTSVVHNPTSNLRFASGICRTVDLREAGIKVALGTDGMLSGYQLNVFAAMRAAAGLQRISHKDASVLTSADVFEMATSTAGEILGTGSGSLDIGAPADIAVLDMTGLHLQPYRRDPLNDRDLLNLIVWCGRPSDVRHVLCNGELVVKDRELTRISSSDIRGRSVKTDTRLRPIIE